MKKPTVLIINGSPHEEGTTTAVLGEMIATFEKEGVECRVIQIGKDPVRGCVGCASCKKTGRCVFDDKVNEAAEIFAEADGLLLASPVYYASPNGSLLAFLDRLFYSSKCDKRMKVGASVAVARRGGLTATFDVLNKYFSISEMPIATSTYWNQVHGAFAEDAKEDLEGLRTVRTLARNMAFLMKTIALAKEEIPLPEREPKVFTNFVRR
ncbi:MAG: flavodoxin family protein [Clostridia bacterium]|nr:flavodoxin family protein [Clostridia bacterium]